MCHVSSRSSVATLRTAIHLLLVAYLMRRRFRRSFSCLGARRRLGHDATNMMQRGC